MKPFKLAVFFLLIAFLSVGYAWSDQVADEQPSEGFTDPEPGINCKTAEQDIASLEKRIAAMNTKLLEDVGVKMPGETVVPSPEESQQNIPEVKSEQQDLQKRIDEIKDVCGL